MTESSSGRHLHSSFRDPSGFLFYKDGKLLRQINHSYKKHYDRLLSSGLYDALVDSGLLIAHREMTLEYAASDDAYKVIEPEVVPFVSYPYEWCFSQLKDAALTTLAVQKKSVEYGMSLKDCSAYNIQFSKCKPVFIDTLSFESYREGEPWVAYRQFCQHLLAPLALMSFTDIRLNQLLRIYIDGIPLDLAGSLLPRRTYFRFSLLSHIHLHAKSQRKYAAKSTEGHRKKISRMGFLGLIDSLESSLKKLKLKAQFTEWADYYRDTHYSEKAFQHKKQLVSDFLDRAQPKFVWDLGGNIGVFSRIAAEKGMETVCLDVDSVAVEYHYRECVKNETVRVLPLVADLTNPSPSIGWQNTERMSFIERGSAQMILALALIHHLAISNNVPFARMAEFFASICDWMMIEFVSKNDSQVQRLLAGREDIFADYNRENFESAFAGHFTIKNCEQITDSERILYLMRRKDA
jgi:hypothetical protein